MKEKIKMGLFGAFIFYVFVVLFLIGLSYERVDYNNFNVSDSQNENLQKFRNELLLMEDNKCNNFIKELVDEYERTNFNGNVSYKEFFDIVYLNDDNSYYSLGEEIYGEKGSWVYFETSTHVLCDISYDDEIFSYFNDYYRGYDNIYNISLRSYELLPDYFVGITGAKYNDENLYYNYRSNRNSMQMIISSLINNSKEEEGVVVNEE